MNTSRYLAAAVSCFALASVCHVGDAVAQTAPASWTGVYGGGFGEYSGGQSTQNDNGFKRPTKKPAPAGGEGGGGGGGIADADGRYGLSGAVGGGLVGYNFQYNQFVFGVEGDIGAGSISGSSSSCGTPAHTCGTRISALADVRGRLGYAVGNFLPYVAGGAAFANLHAYDSLYGSSGGAWRSGYTIGGGIEYKFTPQISVRVEYLHAQFDSQALYNVVPRVPERIGATNDIVRLGISYYLNPPPAPVIAKY